MNLLAFHLLSTLDVPLQGGLQTLEPPLFYDPGSAMQSPLPGVAAI